MRRPEELEGAAALISRALEHELSCRRPFVGTGARASRGSPPTGEFLVPFTAPSGIHERRKGGADSYRVQPADRLQTMLEAATLHGWKALVDYTGVAMVEFKVELKTGRWALIEVNARFWGSLAAGRSPPGPTSRSLSSRCWPRVARASRHYRDGPLLPELGADRAGSSPNLRADRKDRR